MKASSSIGNITQIAVRNHADLQNVLANQHHAAPAGAIGVSGTVRNSDDTEKSTVATSYTKLKEVRLNAALAVVRVSWRLKESGGASVWGFGRVYKNGVAVGTEQTTQDGVYHTYTDDLTGLVANDLIQVYCYTNNAGYPALTDQLRLCYSHYLAVLDTMTLATPLVDTTDPTISVTNQDP